MKLSHREQLRMWVNRHLKQCEEVHRFLDELEIPWHEKDRILTLKERIKLLVEKQS